MQAIGQEGKLVALCKEGGFSAQTLLQHDPEFDGDMPDPKSFLEKQGLAAVADL